MSDDLDGLIRRIEEEARRLSDPELDRESAARAATEVARLAGEAAQIVEGFARSSRPAPAAPGQEALPVDAHSGDLRS